MTKPLSQQQRRRFSLSLGALILLTLVIGSGIGLLTRRERLQGKAREMILGAGGAVGYDYQNRGNSVPAATPRTPAWSLRTIGDHYFHDIVSVQLFGCPVDDDRMAALGGLTQLRFLNIGQTRATDAGLAHLKHLSQLQSLDLVETRVSDAGLAHLRGLEQLRYLNLAADRVTDVGLAHLEGLDQLSTLFLQGTRVGDAGLKHLEGLNQLETLQLTNTQVSDAGLVHLRGMNRLRDLDLGNTRVRGEGLSHLRGLDRLQRLSLYGCPIDDSGVGELKGFGHATMTLDLRKTRVSAEGIKMIKQTLPHCQIRF